MPAFCGGLRPSDSLPQWTVTNRNKDLAACATFGSRPPRHRLAHWVAAGCCPPDLAPAAVAAAFTRATGRPPARDPERRASRAYSRDELALALAELRHRPTPPPAPADPLAVIWSAALQRLPYPSTRMLLLQQCRLLALRPSAYPLAVRGELVALVGAVPHWLPMVESRRHLIADALGETLGRVVPVELVEVAQ